MNDLGQKIEKACQELNKRNSDIWLLKNIYHLRQIEKEVRRNIRKLLENPKHTMHFNSGQLRIIASKLSNKRIKLAKLLSYDFLYHQISKHERIDDKIFNDSIKYAMDLACCQRECNDLANTFNYDAFTCDLAEQQAAQENIKADDLVNDIFKFAIEDCKKLKLV